MGMNILKSVLISEILIFDMQNLRNSSLDLAGLQRKLSLDEVEPHSGATYETTQPFGIWLGRSWIQS